MAIVQLRLLANKLVQVILSAGGIKGPGRATKEAEPVVGRPAIWGRIAPDVPISLGIVPAAAAFEKPGVEILLYLYRLIRYYVVLYLHEIKPVCSEDWCHLQDRLPYVQTG
jgi:hypothetical protein